MHVTPKSRLGYHSRRVFMGLAWRPERSVSVDLLGSSWGGWSVVRGSLDANSIVYSGGIGHDATFDTAVIAMYGCPVHAFDPTPVGRQHGEIVAAEQPAFHFYPMGLWNEDGNMAFSVPRNPSHDSFSIVNLEGTSDSVLCPVRKLSTIMDDLGHDHLDLLKLDIEGAEHAVLADVLAENIRVRQLCVEFDQPVSLRVVHGLVKKLRRHGFDLVARRRWDYTFWQRSYAR